MVRAMGSTLNQYGLKEPYSEFVVATFELFASSLASRGMGRKGPLFDHNDVLVDYLTTAGEQPYGLDRIKHILSNMTFSTIRSAYAVKNCSGFGG